jgi:membrane-associated phospholipid phosphatase
MQPKRLSTLLLIAGLIALGSAHSPRAVLAAGASAGLDQAVLGAIEPNAGKWQTWLLKSGDQFRLPAPPDKAATTEEIKQMKALASQRDSEALDTIAFWNAGAPGYCWNQMYLDEAIRNNRDNPTASRALALLHAAIYDATVAAWDSKYAHNRPRPSEFDSSLMTALPNPYSPSYPSEHAVTAGAASAVLAYLFPDQAQRFADTAEEAANAFVQAGVQYPSDAEAGLELGRKVAELAIARAKTDGFDAKWTGKVPTEAGQWTGENPVLPMAGSWKTWVLKSGSEVRPPPPPKHDSAQMAAELKAVEAFTRTPKSNADAFFWQYGSGATRNHQFWNDQLNKKLMEYRLDDNPPRAARAQALMNIAQYDSGVACWDAKYAYWAIRPFQLDPEFQPLFPTPNHPSYPSAHSCLSMAPAVVLAYLFPHDADSFIALAEQAGDSRVWAGIHFPSDIEAGETLAQAVAQKVIEYAESDGS